MAFNRRYADDAVLLLQVSDSQRQDCKPSVGYQAAKYVFLMLFSDWILELLMCRMIYTWTLLFSSISWRGEVSRCSRSRESGFQTSSSSLNKTENRFGYLIFEYTLIIIYFTVMSLVVMSLVVLFSLWLLFFQEFICSVPLFLGFIV